MVDVIIPDNLGSTINLGAVEPYKWDVKFDSGQFELTADGLHLKDDVLADLANADIVSGVLNRSNLELNKKDGSKIVIPLASLIPAAKADHFLKRINYDTTAKTLNFHVGNDIDSVENSFSVNISDLVPVVAGNGITGDGTSTNPLQVNIKAGTGLKATSDGIALDTDRLIKLTNGTGEVTLGYIFPEQA